MFPIHISVEEDNRLVQLFAENMQSFRLPDQMASVFSSRFLFNFVTLNPDRSSAQRIGNWLKFIVDEEFINKPQQQNNANQRRMIIGRFNTIASINPVCFLSLFSIQLPFNQLIGLLIDWFDRTLN